MEPAPQCLTLAATPSQLFPLHLCPISTLKASRFVFIFVWKLLTCLEHKQQGDGRSFYFLLPSFTLQGMQGIWPVHGQPLLGLLGLYSCIQAGKPHRLPRPRSALVCPLKPLVSACPRVTLAAFHRFWRLEARRLREAILKPHCPDNTASPR